MDENKPKEAGIGQFKKVRLLILGLVPYPVLPPPLPHISQTRVYPWLQLGDHEGYLKPK